MPHGYHEIQPGYSPAQVLHDGCTECAERSESPWLAIEHLDYTAFPAAWARATQLGLGKLNDTSHAEAPVLEVLWAIQVQLERHGVPLGEFPVYPAAFSALLSGQAS